MAYFLITSYLRGGDGKIHLCFLLLFSDGIANLKADGVEVFFRHIGIQGKEQPVFEIDTDPWRAAYAQGGCIVCVETGKCLMSMSQTGTAAQKQPDVLVRVEMPVDNGQQG